jgi:hypothetical protein
MNEELRELVVLAGGAAPRIAKLHGRDHLVVPVVALMEGIIHAVNAPEDEFVPAAALAAAAHTWNGRPLVVGHPVVGGRHVSANDPRILAEQAFGTIFNSRMSGTKMAQEAWVDPERLEALGQHAMLADIRAGRPVEVSVGAGVRVAREAGTHNGRKYGSRWAAMQGDHLAFLPGGRGACSVEMGCGACRAAEAFDMSGDEPVRAAWADGSGADDHGGPIAGGSTGVAVRGPFGRPAASARAKAATAKAERASANAGTPMSHQAAMAAHQEAAAAHREAGDAATAKVHEKLAAGHAGKMAAERPPRPGARAAEGGEMDKKGLLGRARKLLARLAGRAAEDGAAPATPTAEEQAEAISYDAIDALLGSAADKLAAARGHVADLVATEAALDATDAAEADEETLESARLDATRALCMAASADLAAVVQACYALCSADYSGNPIGSQRWMEAVRAAYGKEISAKNLAAVQAAHDAAHTMHDHTTALGADCARGMATKAAQAADEGSETMTKEARAAAIKALNCKCTGLDGAEGLKALEALPDAAIEAMERTRAASEAATKEATDKAAAAETARAAAEAKATGAETEKAGAEARIKALEAGAIPAAELAELRGLAAAKKEQDEAEKAGLVGKLKALGALTEDQLKAKPLDELRTLAAFAKVDAPRADFSGMGQPAQRAAGSATFAPPDPYKAGVDALRAANAAK